MDIFNFLNDGDVTRFDDGDVPSDMVIIDSQAVPPYGPSDDWTQILWAVSLPVYMHAKRRMCMHRNLTTRSNA
jgi:hypothetical protein